MGHHVRIADAVLLPPTFKLFGNGAYTGITPGPPVVRLARSAYCYPYDTAATFTRNADVVLADILPAACPHLPTTTPHRPPPAPQRFAYHLTYRPLYILTDAGFRAAPGITPRQVVAWRSRHRPSTSARAR